MCPLVVNPPPTITAQAGDEVLTPTQLEKLSLFAQLGKKPSFAKLPGTTVLRRFRKGDVIVRQGAAGWTAFYILKGEDVLQLRRAAIGSSPLSYGNLRLKGAMHAVRVSRIALGPCKMRLPHVSKMPSRLPRDCHGGPPRLIYRSI